MGISLMLLVSGFLLTIIGIVLLVIRKQRKIALVQFFKSPYHV